MDDFFNRLTDKVGDFLAERPGALPLAGAGLILLNFLLQVYPGPGAWLVDSNLLLHFGLIMAIVGLLLVRPLG